MSQFVIIHGPESSLKGMGLALQQNGYSSVEFHTCDDLRERCGTDTVEAIHATSVYERYVMSATNASLQAEQIVVSPEAVGTHLGQSVLGFLEASGKYPTQLEFLDSWIPGFTQRSVEVEGCPEGKQ